MRFSVVSRVPLAMAALFEIACAPLPEFPFAADADLAPPVIVTMGFNGPQRLRITFDEPCFLVPGSLLPGETLAHINVSDAVSAPVASTVRSSAPGHPAAMTASGVAPVARQLVFTFSQPPDPAVEHSVEAQVSDQSGNHLRFVAKFYGLNALVPAMVINEFTTQGSNKHPDLVEIRVLTDGNLGGCCIYEGIPGDWDDRFVFPSLEVSAGDFIVVHFKPQGLPDEVDEVTRRDASAGYDATPDAYDFWVRDGNGLSGNNGVLTLCENPVGGIVDAVLYSNRTSESDERYRGFGSTSTMEHADYLVAQRAWTAAGTVRPEDAVNPEDSTATRSLSRRSDSADTNHRDDWHVTPTRGLSPGEINTDEVHVP